MYAIVESLRGKNVTRWTKAPSFVYRYNEKIISSSDNSQVGMTYSIKTTPIKEKLLLEVTTKIQQTQYLVY